MTYMSLFFRFIVLIAFWKASVDYNTIIGEEKKKLGYSSDPRDNNLTLNTLFNQAKKEGYFRNTQSR